MKSFAPTRCGGCLCGAVRYAVHGPLREILWEAPGRDTVSIGAGTLDNPAGLRVAGHIWVEQGAGWETPAGVPAYSRGYPGDAPTLAWG